MVAKYKTREEKLVKEFLFIFELRELVFVGLVKEYYPMDPKVSRHMIRRVVKLSLLPPGKNKE